MNACRMSARRSQRIRKGDTLPLPDHGGVQHFPTGLSITLSYIDTAAKTAGISANCAAIPVAGYKDVRVGEMVEFTGVLFEVSELTEEAVRPTRARA